MWLVIGILVVAAILALAAYGRFSERTAGEHSSAFSLSPSATWLDRALSRLTAANDGRTGLRLLVDNVEAFALRAASARSAERSLDLQYYYWKDDLTGSLLADEVLMAADRGVRVRLLLDDVNAWGRDSSYRALDRHANIEVRLFNPIRCREGALLRGVEMALRCWSLNRRMHHKAWIADGRVAFVGGRNVGDAYFDASQESNFRDTDLMVLGPAVQQTEEMFDRYWNSAMVSPIRKLSDWSRRADLARLRKRIDGIAGATRSTPYLERVRSGAAARGLASGEGIHWVTSAQIVSDPPGKAASARDDGWLLGALLPVITSARKSIAITSPYFIPLDSGARLLLRLAGAGVSISVLTNSLAATDVTAVHGAYSRFRKPLLAGGIRLFELRARDARKDVSLFGSRGASLHTKAFVVDGHIGFVGSFNFDPRSVSLNTEMGLLFDDAGLAGEMHAVYAKETATKRSYKLVLSGDAVAWQDGSASVLDSEPEASLRRRVVAAAASFLPVESQL
ncbi:MAG: phosphatidylserine/phosphatidylglycerophosphate/cardiolipin synthase family protein [Hyphomicrobiales bacterium]|nr:phosphatidylserine/phosphatidylglycerophosphate/cardiolipin synthase family protein [Hyphomicrobiales bacterium]